MSANRIIIERKVFPRQGGCTTELMGRFINDGKSVMLVPNQISKMDRIARFDITNEILQKRIVVANKHIKNLGEQIFSGFIIPKSGPKRIYVDNISDSDIMEAVIDFCERKNINLVIYTNDDFATADNEIKEARIEIKDPRIETSKSKKRRERRLRAAKTRESKKQTAQQQFDAAKVTSYDDKINKLMESIGLTSLNYGNYALVKQWLINGSSDEEILGTLKIMQNAQNKPKIRPIKVASIKVLSKEDADALEALFVPEDDLEQLLSHDSMDKLIKILSNECEKEINEEVEECLPDICSCNPLMGEGCSDCCEPKISGSSDTTDQYVEEETYFEHNKIFNFFKDAKIGIDYVQNSVRGSADKKPRFYKNRLSNLDLEYLFKMLQDGTLEETHTRNFKLSKDKWSRKDPLFIIGLLAKCNREIQMMITRHIVANRHIDDNEFNSFIGTLIIEKILLDILLLDRGLSFELVTQLCKDSMEIYYKIFTPKEIDRFSVNLSVYAKDRIVSAAIDSQFIKGVI